MPTITISATRFEPEFRKPKFFNKRSIVIAILILLGLWIALARAEETYTNDEIANAIYKAEGGARFGYGIQRKYWRYHNLAEARKICLNTIQNNRKRFSNQAQYTDFIEFLGSRYCPIGANNDRGTNKYWVSNVKRFLKKGRAR